MNAPHCSQFDREPSATKLCGAPSSTGSQHKAQSVSSTMPSSTASVENRPSSPPHRALGRTSRLVPWSKAAIRAARSEVEFDMEFRHSQTNRRDHTVVVREGLLLCTSCHALPLWCYTRVHRMRKKLGSFALPSLREFVRRSRYGSCWIQRNKCTPDVGRSIRVYHSLVSVFVINVRYQTVERTHLRLFNTSTF